MVQVKYHKAEQMSAPYGTEIRIREDGIGGSSAVIVRGRFFLDQNLGTVLCLSSAMLL